MSFIPYDPVTLFSYVLSEENLHTVCFKNMLVESEIQT